MSQHTGSDFPSNVSSVGSQMLIVFDSNYYPYTTKRFRGFKANIFYEEANAHNGTNACSVTNPCQVNEGHCHYDGQCHGTLSCGKNNCPQNLSYGYDTNCCYDYCEQFLDMENGILDYFSPHHDGYDNMEECSWQLKVATNFTIYVEFIQYSVCSTLDCAM